MHDEDRLVDAGGTGQRSIEVEEPLEAESGRAHSPWMRTVTAITGPWTRSNLLHWILLIGLILFIKGCLIDQYTIPTGSMEETLHGDPRFFRGDRVLVNKWVYGPRIPFTAIRLWNWAEPKRWDIVVFRPMPGTSAHRTLIKRVVGLPGEQVLIRDGRIHINGKPVDPPESLRDTLHYTTAFRPGEEDVRRLFLKLAQQNHSLAVLNPANETVQQLYADMARLHPQVADMDLDATPVETVRELCAGVSRISLGVVSELAVFDQPPLRYGVLDDPEHSVVPENCYFLLGDNSAQSVDGRVWGWVARNHLFGRTFAVWWPWPRRRDFTGFSQTWWGMALLYGIPAGLIGLECVLFLRERRRRRPPEA